MSRGLGKRRKTADRGYGGAHQRERAKYVERVDAGHEFCRRCWLPIPAHLGWGGYGRCPKCGKNHRGWDLGHSDFNRAVWTGPEHVCCNRATYGRKAVIERIRNIARQHREW